MKFKDFSRLALNSRPVQEPCQLHYYFNALTSLVAWQEGASCLKERCWYADGEGWVGAKIDIISTFLMNAVVNARYIISYCSKIQNGSTI